MSEAFNPYYKWLGIPPEEQPATHYRLLGLRQFESDPDVIEAAADRIMGQLRKYGAGPHSADSQKLLNEVSAARLCLLDPKRKVAYDAKLRGLRVAQALPSSAGTRHRSESGPSSPDGQLHDAGERSTGLGEAAPIRKRTTPVVVEGTATRTPLTPVAPARRKQPVQIAVISAAAAGGLLLLALFVFALSGSNESRGPASKAPPKPTKIIAEKPSEPVKVPVQKPPTPAPVKAGLPRPLLTAAPFNAFQAAEHQRRWAQYLGCVAEEESALGVRLLLIPPGQFEMGASPEDIQDVIADAAEDTWAREHAASEGPRHDVLLSKPFWVSKHEVTRSLFRKFVNATGYKTEAESDGKGGQVWQKDNWEHRASVDWRNPGLPQQDNHPVVQVTWNDAVAFCKWLGRQETATYRLPTEAEWEYACRAGSDGRWCFGNAQHELAAHAWFAGNLQGEWWSTVGQRQPNGWGIHDMHGNVWEWCADWYSGDYYRLTQQENPQGPGTGSKRVIRGGGGEVGALATRSASRCSAEPNARYPGCGFRVVREVQASAGRN